MAVVSPSKHTPEFVFTKFENNSGWDNDAVAWSIGLLSSCYVLIGYDGATHLSEEMDKAETGVPRAMVGSILINWPLGFAFLLVVLFFMGDVNSALNTPTGFPIIQIFYNMTGSVTAATCLAGAITAMAALSTVPLITSAARIMWAFARDGGEHNLTLDNINPLLTMKQDFPSPNTSPKLTNDARFPLFPSWS